MELNYYLSNIEYGEAVLILGSKYNKEISIKGNTVKEFLLQVATERRIIQVIKMLGIQEDILNLNYNDLSNLDVALVVLAYQLLKGKDLVINFLDVLLNYKEEQYLKKVLNKLVHQYKVKLAVFTNNMNFCFHLIDRIIIVEDKEIKKYLSNDFYNLELYDYIDMPEIIRFVSILQAKGKKIDNYLDMSELIKGIYRL